ncbi:MAG: hypothetical protein HKN50_11430 [Gammaproteobacteria bacterium]|nr:hypothetical protein [Gammaproteobacteria bacterium]
MGNWRFRLKNTLPIGLLGALLLVAMPGAAKPSLQRIEIAGDGLPTPLVIDDPAIISQFSIWFTPFQYPATAEDTAPAPSVSVPTGPVWFADASRGLAPKPSADHRWWLVTMHMGDAPQPLTFRFVYTSTAERQNGYVYLPDWTNSAIVYGRELNWLHGHPRWDELILPIIKSAANLSAAPVDLGCWLGPAYVTASGEIKFKLLDERGNLLSRWHYQKDTPGYHKVQDHIGAVPAEQQFIMSCWPARPL